ncbi:DUF695 domain-containing protein [Hyunsoonleella flava]|uniref:DUF695 domain-containing protein n=1 Tax=Hyunsoonleella flava TaxID=2527939 RepID=A0A4Q9FE61_9FLAO|nr:DUF695 domain-containing protein [Hyunsoonleella flava]TBN03935.1 DUF695 domain-containing protein [Hyunsoonleella flava]
MMTLFLHSLRILYSEITRSTLLNGLEKNAVYIPIFFLCFNLASQESEGYWETYMASYEDGKPGSTTVRMDLIDKAPIAEYKYVLVTGITYESNSEDGLPKSDATFKLLHKIGDELETLLKQDAESLFVGSFMFDFERLEYFYLKSDVGIKEKVETFYKTNYPDRVYYLNIKEDQKWEYYTQFLYPNEAIQNYMSDIRLINELKTAGDNLTKVRRVDHWMYFRTKEDMERCKENIVKLDFEIEFSGSKGVVKFPYSLQFYKYNKVDIDTMESDNVFITRYCQKLQCKI